MRAPVLPKGSEQVRSPPPLDDHSFLGSHDVERLYIVAYTEKFYRVGMGFELPVSGGAILTIEVNAPAQPTQQWAEGTHYRVTPAVRGYRTFRDLVYGGTYGYTHFGLGVRGRLPFRVFKLDGPSGGSRLVVDIAHQW